MNNNYDLLVVGGGVLGTFHAYHALQRGLKVALIEKDARPQSATVRNFGQVVPSGMNQKWQNFGRESLALYKNIQAEFDISIRQNGTVYLASDEEELTLLEELYQINRSNDYESELLTKASCLEKYPGLKSSYVKGGLFFPQEVTVEPTVMIHRLHEYMRTQMQADLFFNTAVLDVQSSGASTVVTTATGAVFKAAKVIICNGSDFQLLFPKLYRESDLIVSKLQMMKTKPQANYELKGSILTGLTIRRYEAFEECPSWEAIKQNEPTDTFEREFGVHILFKQAADGSVIIGDSHEYASAEHSAELGYDLKEEIDAFMIAEAKKIFDLPTYAIDQRWAGFYSQCKTQDVFQYNVDDNIHIVTGIGGKGMTGSAGFAQKNISELFNLTHVRTY
jgi:FAD dependent oxidoreductase TIGR03364